jgi:hypothetical protein
MEMMTSYIVRIYRVEKDNPRKFVGTVETVGIEEKEAFSNVDELWKILISGKKQARRKCSRKI